MIASRDIVAGELVLSESPTLIDNLTRTNSSIKFQFDKLTPEKQVQLLNLANSHPELPQYQGLLETNALPLGFTQTGRAFATEAAIFLLGSRFNHHCVPNVMHHWNEAKRKEEFHALVGISAGSELFICYSDSTFSKSTRQQALKSFGFLCDCSACSLPAADSNARDARLAVIRSNTEAMASIVHRPDQYFGKGIEALRLLKAEGIMSGSSALAYDLFQCCTAWSDYSNAKKWAKKMMEWYTLELGLDSAEVVHATQSLAHPESHRLGGAFKARKVVGGPESI
jgi:hypothetical protein